MWIHKGTSSKKIKCLIDKYFRFLFFYRTNTDIFFYQISYLTFDQRNPRVFGEETIRYPIKIVPGMCPSIKTTLDNLYGFRRRVVRRRLNTRLLCVVVFF